jgi:hypothetical protein
VTLRASRDRTLVGLCGVAPDLDGLGLLMDGANKVLGRPGTWYFGQYHHVLLHGLPAAISSRLPSRCSRGTDCEPSLSACSWFTFTTCAIWSDHAGPAPDDIWPISYLAPFSDRWTFQWSGQWPLNAWPNVLFTAGLMGYALYRAIRSGYSPVDVISRTADTVFVETVRRRWRTLRSKPR